MSNEPKKTTPAKATPQERAAQPDGFAEYPKMLYLKGKAAEQRTVNSAEDEAAAVEEGWTETISA